jgi:hypothetical protein
MLKRVVNRSRVAIISIFSTIYGCPMFLFINIQEVNPASGRYLIDIDGSILVNHLQRLPGKKLAMSLGDSSIEVAQEDIKVIDRVAMIIDKN